MRENLGRLDYFQMNLDMHMEQNFADAALCMAHANRVTLMGKDLLLARKIRGELPK